ncbi:PpiC-type peptidyl-prolyl cis-trans isomerase [Anaeromyxobacter sp. Fw109-5]|nr:PpiC-type peptidyl-prolyl cis-trans isomerase [Anaeromyxobacter sp. Fw109-5]
MNRRRPDARAAAQPRSSLMEKSPVATNLARSVVTTHPGPPGVSVNDTSWVDAAGAPSRVKRAVLLAALVLGCSSSDPADVVGRFDGGVVTAEDLHREASRLPPLLRARFETEAGRRDMVGAIVDKRLLAREARRRKLHEDPEIRRELEELEERLAIQALLAAEEKARGSASDAELRAWYDSHGAELAQPERLRVRRVLAKVDPGASRSDRERARERAERFAGRLRAGERFEAVAVSGDGPERARGGDLGLIGRGDGKDARLESAAFELPAVGARSPVIELTDGFAVLELIERRPGRVPSFEEARGEVSNRLVPQLKRKAFDELLSRLRRDADVEFPSLAGPR